MKRIGRSKCFKVTSIAKPLKERPQKPPGIPTLFKDPCLNRKGLQGTPKALQGPQGTTPKTNRPPFGRKKSH